MTTYACGPMRPDPPECRQCGDWETEYDGDDLIRCNQCGHTFPSPESDEQAARDLYDETAMEMERDR